MMSLCGVGHAAESAADGHGGDGGGDGANTPPACIEGMSLQTPPLARRILTTCHPFAEDVVRSRTTLAQTRVSVQKPC